MPLHRLNMNSSTMYLVAIGLTFVLGIGSIQIYWNKIICHQIPALKKGELIHVVFQDFADTINRFQVQKLDSDSLEIAVDTFRNGILLQPERHNPQIKQSQVFMSSHPGFLRWLMINLFFCGIAWASLVPNLYVLIELRRNLRWPALAGAVTFTLGVLVYLYAIAHDPQYFIVVSEIMGEFRLFFDDKTKAELVANWFVGTIMGSAGIGFIGMVIINFRTARFRAMTNVSVEMLLEEYKYLANRMNYLILFLSIMVSSSIFGTGAFLECLKEEVGGAELIYSPEIVYVYGSLYSFALFLIYIPSWLFLYQCARERLGNGLSEQTSMLKFPIFDKLQAALSIALPLLSGLVQ